MYFLHKELRKLKVFIFLTLLVCGICTSLSCSDKKTNAPVTQPNVTIYVSKNANREITRLMLRLDSQNWHDRFVAAYELKKRGHDTGIPALRAGVHQKDWFVRVDAMKHIVLCEAVSLGTDVYLQLFDKLEVVSICADRTLAALMSSYPQPLESNRKKAWKKWFEENPQPDRMALIREALLTVNTGLTSTEPEKRIEALMVLRSLKADNKTERTASLLEDDDPAVLAVVLEMLNIYVKGTRYNKKVEKLLSSPNKRIRAQSSIFLTNRNLDEKYRWSLHEALSFKDLQLDAHLLLVRIFKTGPALHKKLEDCSSRELSNAWKKWLITDDVLKGRKNWQDYVNNTSKSAPSIIPKTTGK